MKIILSAFLIICISVLIISCKKSNGDTIISSTSNWNLDSVKYTENVNVGTVWDNTRNSLMCYGISVNPALSAISGQFVTNAPATIQFEFNKKPTINRIYSIDITGNRPLNDSTCSVAASAVTWPPSYFSYKGSDKVSVTISGGKLTISVTNLGMKREVTFTTTTLSGTFIEN